jgi:hypothetical protein
MKRITLGAFFGPFLGVSFSLLAVQHTQGRNCSNFNVDNACFNNCPGSVPVQRKNKLERNSWEPLLPLLVLHFSFYNFIRILFQLLQRVHNFGKVGEV